MVVRIVRSNVSNPEVRPAPEGPGCSSRFPTTTVGLTYPSVIILELSPGGGGGTAGVSTASNLF